MSRTLLVATASYPFGRSSDFLEPEIGSLAAHFDRVILLPTAPHGPRVEVPENVDVDTRVAESLANRQRRILSAIRSRRGLRLIDEAVRGSGYPPSTGSWLHLLAAVGIAEQVQRWADSRAERPDVALTVWANAAALGLARSGIATITRAHGGDLYAERHPHSYMPLQHEILRDVRAIHPVSDQGAEYLKNRFPDIASKVAVRHLGIVGAAQISGRSTDGRIRIVSCSSLTSVKRPRLIAEIVAAVGRTASGVDWDHFGTGPLDVEVQAVATGFPPSVRWTLHGQVSNADLYEHYASRPVDVFLNASSSEGVPVSIMEALSAGIPIVAPDVGGIGEIVNEENGRFFRADAETESIAALVIDTVSAFAYTPREAVRETWAARFSAEANYQSFAAELAAFRP